MLVNRMKIKRPTPKNAEKRNIVEQKWRLIDEFDGKGRYIHDIDKGVELVISIGTLVDIDVLQKRIKILNEETTKESVSKNIDKICDYGHWEYLIFTILEYRDYLRKLELLAAEIVKLGPEKGLGFAAFFHMKTRDENFERIDVGPGQIRLIGEEFLRYYNELEKIIYYMEPRQRNEYVCSSIIWKLKYDISAKNILEKLKMRYGDDEGSVYMLTDKQTNEFYQSLGFPRLHDVE